MFSFDIDLQRLGIAKEKPKGFAEAVALGCRLVLKTLPLPGGVQAPLYGFGIEAATHTDEQVARPAVIKHIDKYLATGVERQRELKILFDLLWPPVVAVCGKFLEHRGRKSLERRQAFVAT
jgi:hypothetical protein